MQIDLSKLEDKWPSAVVARSKVGEFSGGLINPGTLANLDSQGEGPEGRFYVGRCAAYPARSLRLWLERRASVERKEPPNAPRTRPQ
jgi:hypothetical protein